jgi:endonuclease/exonuclease/phosphatase family metal-dependent hydrolase
MRCVTAGALPPLGLQTIDHIVLTRNLTATRVTAISNYADDTRLTDHFGVVCTVQFRAT